MKKIYVTPRMQQTAFVAPLVLTGLSLRVNSESTEMITSSEEIESRGIDFNRYWEEDWDDEWED